MTDQFSYPKNPVIGPHSMSLCLSNRMLTLGSLNLLSVRRMFSLIPWQRTPINAHTNYQGKNPDLGFNNKRVGRLISRSLRNKTKAHVSSIKAIEVHESSDSEIEKFLEEEDPTYHKFDQPHSRFCR
jgi:hypothetical protein